MADWQTAPLHEVLDFREGPGIMAADFRDEGVPLLRLAGLKRGANLLQGCNFLDPEKVEQKWKQFRVRAGDVLLSTSASLGEVAVVPAEAVGAVPYTGIIGFRPADDRVDAGFIRHMLTTPTFKAQIEAMGVGSVMKHFGPSHLRKMTVSFPSVPEQRAIAEVLGALDEKIAANDSLVASADSLARVRTFAAITSQTVPLSQAATITMGSSPPGTSYNESGVGTVFHQGVRDFGVRSPRKRVWTTEPVRLAAAGDTLVSVRAPVGRTNLASESLCLGRGVAGARAKDGRQATLFHLLRSVDSVWTPFEAEGTIFGSINKAQLESVAIPCVRNDQQDRLEEQLAGLEARIAAALRETVILAATRDSLLPLLMSGKVRVKDAEKHLRGAV